MIDVLIHPAESHEFLSRLHDGELSPAELAAFRAHGAECAECRDSVETFERALSAYRESPEGPPAADLSARILRKLRAQTPMRRPFGVTFGIDVRWAGAVAAALLVFLIAAPLVLRRPGPADPAGVGTTVRILETDAANEETAPGDAQQAAPPSVAAPPAPARPRPSGERERERADAGTQKSNARAKGNAAVVAPPFGEKPASKDAFADASPRQAAEEPAKLRRREAAASAPLAASEDQTTDAPDAAKTVAGLSEPRLVVQAGDGRGDPPAVASAPPAERLAPLRGRTFVLFVEPDGRVREVSEAFTRDQLAARDEVGDAKLKKEDGGTGVLKQLVFAPGDSPRRLLASVN